MKGVSFALLDRCGTCVFFKPFLAAGPRLFFGYRPEFLLPLSTLS